MARPRAASAGGLAGAAGHGERGRLGDLRRDLGVLLLVAGLHRGDLRAELRIPGIGHVDGRELPQVRDAPQLQAHMRRELQVRPVAVEVLDHIHRAGLELPAKRGAHHIRLHRGVGPDLAHQLQARVALLLAGTGLEGEQVDVEDHGLLLLLVTGGPPGAPVSGRLVVAAPGPWAGLPAGCEPRAGLREMPSRRLRDYRPHPRAGRRPSSPLPQSQATAGHAMAGARSAPQTSAMSTIPIQPVPSAVYGRSPPRPATPVSGIVARRPGGRFRRRAAIRTGPDGVRARWAAGAPAAPPG